VDGGALSRQFGRGTPWRAQAGLAGLKASQRMPEPVLKLAMKMLTPPDRSSRKGDSDEEDT
jgi:acyl-CoA dehydrogenase